MAEQDQLQHSVIKMYSSNLTPTGSTLRRQKEKRQIQTFGPQINLIPTFQQLHDAQCLGIRQPVGTIRAKHVHSQLRGVFSTQITAQTDLLPLIQP